MITHRRSRFFVVLLAIKTNDMRFIWNHDRFISLKVGSKTGCDQNAQSHKSSECIIQAGSDRRARRDFISGRHHARPRTGTGSGPSGKRRIRRRVRWWPRWRDPTTRCSGARPSRHRSSRGRIWPARRRLWIPSRRRSRPSLLNHASTGRSFGLFSIVTTAWTGGRDVDPQVRMPKRAEVRRGLCTVRTDGEAVASEDALVTEEWR